MQISVTGDISKMERHARDITDKVKGVATVRALNKMAARVRTDVPRMVRDEGYNVKVSRVKKDLQLMRASGGRLVAVVRASGWPIPAIEWGARQTKAGVTLNVKNGRKLLRGSFIATMPNGHKGVFFKAGPKNKWVKKNGKRYRTRLPIVEEYGPSVPGIVVNAAIERRVGQAVASDFPDILRREVAYASR